MEEPSEQQLETFLERFRELGLSPQRGEEGELGLSPQRDDGWPAGEGKRSPVAKVELPLLGDPPARCALLLLETAFAHRPIAPDALARLSDPLRQRLSTVLAAKFLSTKPGSAARLRRRRKAEEELKLVVKRGVRSLFLRFKSKHRHFVHGRKTLDELEFYEHFFGAAGLPLEHYLLPGSKLQRERRGELELEKTVTAGYLQRLAEARPFREQLEEFLAQRLLPEYREARRRKLLRIAQLIAAETPTSFQLPWSDEEILFARDNVLRLLGPPPVPL